MVHAPVMHILSKNHKGLSIPERFSMEGLRSFLDRLSNPSESIMGFLHCGGEDDGLLLFLFHGEPYAAAMYHGEELRPLSLEEFRQKAERLDTGTTLYMTNPVFFKLMLVVVQCQPSVVGSSQVINLESLLDTIEKGRKEQVLLLKKGNELNLFYFRDGKLVDGYFSNPSQKPNESNGLNEALLIYTFEPGSPVEIRLYDDVHVGNKKSPVQDVPPELAVIPLLEIRLGDNRIEKSIDKKTYVIGRGVKNDCVIDDVSVSREHARIICSPEGYILEDLKSRNGTYLEGRRIVKEKLADGSMLRFGSVEIQFYLPLPTPSQSDAEDRTEVLRMVSVPEKLWFLEVVEGNQKGSSFPLSPGRRISLGRGSVDVLLNDAKVSRHHADIEWVDGELLFKDLQSTNGSFINEQKVTQLQLVPGDILRIGETVLRVIHRV